MKISSYASLPSHYKKNSCDYFLAKRGRRTMIYEQRISKSQSYWEVFKIKISEERIIKIGNTTKILPACERAPNNEAGGDWLWTYITYADAEKKFNVLENSKS